MNLVQVVIHVDDYGDTFGPEQLDDLSMPVMGDSLHNQDISTSRNDAVNNLLAYKLDLDASVFLGPPDIDVMSL
jgi:hypothetical protein